MNNDIINAMFQFASAIFILNNCRVLYNDKQVRGVSVASVAFFFAWGVWNLIFYPTLGQTYSFYAGVIVVMANSMWLYLMMYYRGLESE